MVYALPTIDPLSSVTQRPQISDLSSKDPQFLILSPKTHSLWSTWCLMFHKSLVWRKFSNSVDQKMAHNEITERPTFLLLSLNDPIIFDLLLKDPLFFGCSCHWKTPMSEVLGGTCTSLWYMSAHLPSPVYSFSDKDSYNNTFCSEYKKKCYNTIIHELITSVVSR